MQFSVEQKYEHIVPALLDRIWNVDNKKQPVLSGMAENGGVTGDCFVKVAYEAPWVDSVSMYHPGRVRILPLNSSQVFPEYHPHDRDRLLRLKIKYKFWGTSLEGTRQVYTYTEIVTAEWIEEYVNDELLDARANPLGTIPIVHIRNVPVSGSPWGISDISDLIPLNREFNEQATNISDIISYHAAPVTIVTGSKVSNLEKGPRKIWGGLPKDAKVFNLENGVDLQWPLEYLNFLKRTMHEISGVPESALGQMQPISNTSGVALAILYLPAVQQAKVKHTQYGAGLDQINELALRTLFTYEPETLLYNPDSEGIITDPETQQLILDPLDPQVYQVTCVWPQPLPVDVLVKLNELQVKMELGLESRRGALRELGVEFVDEKVQELYDERLLEAREDAALAYIKAKFDSVILQATGMLPPDGSEAPPPPPNAGQNPDGANTAGPLPGLPGVGTQDNQSVLSELVTLSAGTKLAQRRNPGSDAND